MFEKCVVFRQYVLLRNSRGRPLSLRLSISISISTLHTTRSFCVCRSFEWRGQGCVACLDRKVEVIGRRCFFVLKYSLGRSWWCETLQNVIETLILALEMRDRNNAHPARCIMVSLNKTLKFLKTWKTRRKNVHTYKGVRFHPGRPETLFLARCRLRCAKRKV